MSVKIDGFAHDQMGQILLLLSEFRLNAHTWMHAGETVPNIAAEDTWSNFSVSHDLSVCPEKGIPYLQLSTIVGLTADSSEKYWWSILVNLPLRGEQRIFSRLRAEYVDPSEYGPQTIFDIYKGELPCGEVGVLELVRVCDATLKHLKSSLSNKSINEFAQGCKRRLGILGST